jgi:arylsulfatase A-like enzyme
MALDFAGRHSRIGKPWVYYLAYGPPHKPEQCPDRFLELYDPQEFELPEDLRGRFPADVEQSLRRYFQVYYGQVTAIDHEVGRLLKGLDELGIADNTIVLYTSDHGDHLGSHCPPRRDALRGKASPYATAFRIPLLVRWPKRVKAGGVTDSLVSSVDLAPTILDLAGLRIPAQMQGDSMASWCLQGQGKRNRALFLGLGGLHNEGWRGVWDGRFVYSPVGYNHLYDHRNDPLETENLVESATHMEQRLRLGEVLIALAAETEDPLLEKIRNATSRL